MELGLIVVSEKYLNLFKPVEGPATWTPAQLQVFNIPYPAPEGWMKSVIGTRLSITDQRRFESGISDTSNGYEPLKGVK